MFPFNIIGLLSKTFSIRTTTRQILHSQLITLVILASWAGKNLAQELCSTTNTFEDTHLNGSRQLDGLINQIDAYNKSINWYEKYIDEQTEEFDVITDDGLVDTRLANMNYVLNLVRPLNRDIYTFNMGDEETNNKLKRMAAGSRVNDKLCGLQLSQMMELMEDLESKLEEKRKNHSSLCDLNESHHRLAKVLDSFGRYEAGILVGRTQFPGSYGQCHGSQMILDKGNSIKKTNARYCTAKLRVDRHLDSELKSKVRFELQPDSLIFAGICIPESCHSKSFHDHQLSNLIKRLVSSQFKLPNSVFLEEELDLDSVYCSPDDDSPLAKLPFSGKLLILTLIVWFVAMFYVNYKGKCPEEKPGLERIFLSLNLHRAWHEFISAGGNQDASKRNENRVQLNTLNPIKAIGCFMVVLGHSYFILASSGQDLLRTYKTLESDMLVSFLTGTTVVVDTFFLITGLLITYITLTKAGSIGSFRSASTFTQHAMNSLKLAASRYFRLVPLYFLVFWFKKSIFAHLSSGPNWDYGLNKGTILGGCRQESWLSPLTMMAAYLPLTNQCMAHCWSVANDIAACFILFPILVFMTRRPMMAIILSTTIIVMSNLAMYSSMSNLEPEIRHEFRRIRIHASGQLFVQSSYIYTAPQNRVFAVLVGAIAGYTLYLYNLNTTIREWPRWFKGLATKLSLATVITILGSATLVPYFREYGLIESSPFIQELAELSYTGGRLFWTIANAIIFLRMTTDWKDNSLMISSANRFWRTLSMLNYTIFIIHVDIILLSITSRTSTYYYSGYDILSSVASTYLISLVLGTIIHLTLENPIDKLIRSYLSNVKMVTGVRTKRSSD